MRTTWKKDDLRAMKINLLHMYYMYNTSKISFYGYIMKQKPNLDLGGLPLPPYIGTRSVFEAVHSSDR